MRHKLWSVPVTHPAFTFRKPDAIGPLQAHMTGFVRRVVDGFGPPPLILKDPSHLRLEWLVTLAKERRLAVGLDIEAAPPNVGPKEWALLPKYAMLRAFGLGLDVDHNEGGKRYSGVGLSWFYPCEDPRVWRAFLKAMADPDLAKVLCNGHHYDIPILERFGVPINGPIHDIKDARRALVSTSRTGLAPQAAIYLQVGPWKAEALAHEGADEKGFVDPSRIPRSKLLRYNALDCVHTAKIRGHHVREFNEDPTDKPRLIRLYKQQLRLAVVASEMSYKGFPIHEGKRRQLRQELTDLFNVRARELEAELKLHTAVKILDGDEDPADWKGKAVRISPRGGINENDLAALLFKEARRKGINSFDLDVPMSEKCRTDTGKPAVNKKSLLILFTQPNTPPEVKKLIKLAWRCDAPLKARSTYIDSDKVLTRIGSDMCLHAGINSAGTETGRWTCSDPNLFNLSETKTDDDVQGALPNVRGMLWSGDDEWVIVHRDFKQLELEVIAERTGDRTLRVMLDTGDAHNARVILWWKLPKDAPIPKQLRKLSKNVGFACNYNAGLETVYVIVLEKDPDAQFDHVAACYNLFRENHVGIVEAWDSTMRFAKEFGFSETPITGRRRYYPPWEEISPTEPLNYEIQGGAADIANDTLVGTEESEYKDRLHAKLARYFPSAWIAMHTYDSFDVICRRQDAEAVGRLMDECMSVPRKVGTRMHSYKSDLKIGTYWSEV